MSDHEPLLKKDPGNLKCALSYSEVPNAIFIT